MKKVILNILFALMPLLAGAYDVKIDGICYNLHLTTLEADVTYSIVTEEGAWISDYSGDVVIPSSITHEGIPYKVTYVTDNAFAECEGLTSVVLPNSIKKMGLYVFEGCTNLVSVKLPDGIEELGNLMFAECTSLPSVTIPSSVRKIGPSAFSACHSMKTITIPSSVEVIDDWAFCYGEGLTDITIPSTVKKLGKGVFLDCRNLKNVELPTSIDVLENEMFEGCSNLETLVIPDNFKNIGRAAFLTCSKLSSITLGSSVSSIGDKAFTSCRSLKEIVSRIENPFDVTNVDFPEDVYEQAVLYVPTGTVDLYKTTEGWKRFFKIVEIGTIVPCKIDIEINAEGGHLVYGDKVITEEHSTIECHPGSDVTLKIVPNEGRAIAMVLIGWDDVTDNLSSDNTYTISNVRSDMTFRVIFGMDSSGISEIDIEDSTKDVYDIMGKKITSRSKGLYIIRNKTGKTNKVLLK